ncbi:MAG: hypothetical protein ACTSU5_19630 [Promethearchaeota archaeon]
MAVDGAGVEKKMLSWVQTRTATPRPLGSANRAPESLRERKCER